MNFYWDSIAWCVKKEYFQTKLQVTPIRMDLWSICIHSIDKNVIDLSPKTWRLAYDSNWLEIRELIIEYAHLRKLTKRCYNRDVYFDKWRCACIIHTPSFVQRLRTPSPTCWLWRLINVLYSIKDGLERFRVQT